MSFFHIQEFKTQPGEPMYAHAGVVSAATALLTDLEEKGILRVRGQDRDVSGDNAW